MHVPEALDKGSDTDMEDKHNLDEVVDSNPVEETLNDVLGAFLNDGGDFLNEDL